MSQKQSPRLRIAIVGAAGGQAAHFIALLLSFWIRAELVALVETYPAAVATARERARDYNDDLAELRNPRSGRRPGQPRRRRRSAPRQQPAQRPCRVFTSLEDLIRWDRYDLAIVCTWPEFHASQIIALLRAHKRILAEKPPTMTFDEMITVAQAEAASRGWVAWNFQLWWQWFHLIETIATGLLGGPIELEAVWHRGYIVAEDATTAEQVRRGQRGRPMLDLCHMVHAVVSFLPDARLLRVLGFSRTHGSTVYETLVATFAVEDQGEETLVQAIIRCGFQVHLHRTDASEDVRVIYQGTRGRGTVVGLVDDRLAPGPLAPELYLPQVTAVTPAGDHEHLTSGNIAGPQPRTVVECLGKTLGWVLDLAQTETPQSGGLVGLRVMQLLDAFDRSVSEGCEVAATPIPVITPSEV